MFPGLVSIFVVLTKETGERERVLGSGAYYPRAQRNNLVHEDERCTTAFLFPCKFSSIFTIMFLVTEGQTVARGKFRSKRSKYLITAHFSFSSISIKQKESQLPQNVHLSVS